MMHDDEFEELPACITCEYLQDGAICKAFPKGIPDEFLLGVNDHSKPYPGDNGIQYKRTMTKS